MSESYNNIEVVIKNRYNKLDDPFIIRTSNPSIYITSIFFEKKSDILTFSGNLLYYYDNMNWIPYSLYLKYKNDERELKYDILSRSFNIDVSKSFIFTKEEEDIKKDIYDSLTPFMVNLSFITTDSVVYQFDYLQTYNFINMITYNETVDALDNHIYEVDFILRFRSLITNDRRFSKMKNIFTKFIEKYESYTWAYTPYKSLKDEEGIKYIASQILQYCKDNGLVDADAGYFKTMSKLELLKSALGYEVVTKNNE